MRTEAAVTTGRWVRLLLLLSTLVGLATMHTLGHGAHASGGHRAGHPTQPAGHHLALPAVLAEPAATVGAAVGAVADCPGAGCHARALPLTGPGADRSGWSVCLAVLGAFAVALLVAVLLRAGPWTVGRAARGSRRPACGPRAPPPRPWGLRLATVSVLRR
ncbi:hypothetical protein [Micromonospora kangleipakensis]|uniref:hypothetical protein n=1 Tax=Micromonospora kangleipakensis TaxID=1077942 RepID=UPI001029FA1A|nr:hypothetical protein [Micromonospora kangleipakensis]